MAIWLAIAVIAGIIFVLGIFYLMNSIYRYGKWIAPTILMILSLLSGIGCGLKAYQLHEEDKRQQSTSIATIRSAQSSSHDGMVENGFQLMDQDSREDHIQQQVLKSLQQNFAQVGNVTLDQKKKIFTITPTTSENAKAISYVIDNPQKAQQVGYNNLTAGILNTSKQLDKPLGKGYTIQLMQPNSNQIIYSARDGQVLVDVVNDKN